MAETILFVFEGAKTEKDILDSLKQYYLNDSDDIHICVTFNTHIYTLYREVKDDDFLDIVEVLRTRGDNEDDLKDIHREDVSQVFLFFDYDGHVPGASDEQILELLQYFNEETEKGKLYVSYPMVEALKHVNRKVSFDAVCVDAKNNIRYKGLAHREGDPTLQNYVDLKHEQWNHIICEHCKKLNYIVLGVFELPKKHFPQEEVFNNQLEKHIKPKGQVAVLSAFPVFIVDFYGTSILEKLTS